MALLWVARIIFVILCSITAWQLSEMVGMARPLKYIMPLVGLVAGILLVKLESITKKVLLLRPAPSAVGLVLGVLLGAAISQLFLDQVVDNFALSVSFRNFAPLFLIVLFGYIGAAVGVSWKPRTDATSRILAGGNGEALSLRDVGIPKILDTCVIIDGRIADICETDFVEGKLIVPQFVLSELQNIADSADPLRRARGRRGLDIINRLKNGSDRFEVEISEQDFPDIAEVDAKLVQLTKLLNGKILTTDFNLNKVASIQGVRVLNINDLANAMKPALLPGDTLQIRVIKEGKEANQGVGYLDDGTMVVVEEGKKYQGRDMQVEVTSVIQTQAGRMIFSKVSMESDARRVQSSAR